MNKKIVSIIIFLVLGFGVVLAFNYLGLFDNEAVGGNPQPMCTGSCKIGYQSPNGQWSVVTEQACDANQGCRCIPTPGKKIKENNCGIRYVGGGGGDGGQDGQQGNGKTCTYRCGYMDKQSGSVEYMQFKVNGEDFNPSRAESLFVQQQRDYLSKYSKDPSTVFCTGNYFSSKDNPFLSFNRMYTLLRDALIEGYLNDLKGSGKYLLMDDADLKQLAELMAFRDVYKEWMKQILEDGKTIDTGGDNCPISVDLID